MSEISRLRLLIDDVLYRYFSATYLYQNEQDRMAEIERDNRVLMEKMSHTMRTRGRIDNRNEYAHKRYDERALRCVVTHPSFNLQGVLLN